MKLENHPCFNEGACRSFGRIHLPVASRCNVQCNFCNRKFDCMNESRPGVTSGILTPEQALHYLDGIMAERNDIRVVGIAGPGDPFANPEETFRTLELVREKYPNILLCLATNGLNLWPYLDEITRLRVSHVSITVNAVNIDVGAKIYAWVRNKKRTLGPKEGAENIYENQIKSIEGLKKHGVIVKINSVVIPGINAHHVISIAESMGQMGVDLFNCMPYYPNKGSNFEYIAEPSPGVMAEIQKKAGRFVKQMRHCTRCRADAVGLLGETEDRVKMEQLRAYNFSEPKTLHYEQSSKRPFVAVASMEGVLVNLHLGEAEQLYIYRQDKNRAVLEDIRYTPKPGGGAERWKALSGVISDCGTVLVSGAGETPRSILDRNGIKVFEVEGMIEEAVLNVFEGRSLNHMIKRHPRACGSECSGGGVGCI